jgi:carbon-monoxide dehydrogenase small subunit
VGRTGLVRDLAKRLVAEFADNLDRRLSGRAQAELAPQAALDGLSLLVGALREQTRRWLGGLVRR